MAAALLASPDNPKPKPLTAETPVERSSSNRRTTSCCVAALTVLIKPCDPISTASARSRPGFWLISAKVLKRGPDIRTSGLSRTIRTTGMIARNSATPPPRNTSRSPNRSPARPPTTGPIAPPSAIADVTTPNAHPTRKRGVSAATSAVAAATVPLVAPCRNLKTMSSVGFCTKKINPTKSAPPTIDRIRDRRGHRDGPAFACALEAFRVRVCRRHDVHQNRRRSNLARADDRVVEKAGRAESAVGVVRRGLVQRVAKTVRVAPVHLALDDELVDRLPRVVGDDVAKDLDLASLGIDRDYTGVAPAREGKRTVGVEAFQDLEALLRDHLRNAHAPGRRAAHRDDAVLEHEVGGIRLEHVTGAFEQLLAQRYGSFRGRVAHLDRAPAAGRQQGRRHVSSVGGGDMDLLERPTQPVRGHLRRHRLVALPLRRRTHIEEGGAVLLNPDSSRLAAPEPSGFDATCNPHPDESPIAQARNLAQLFEGEREQARIVAAVVDEAAAAARVTGRERDLLRLDQIEPSHLSRRHRKSDSQAIDHPLHR